MKSLENENVVETIKSFVSLIVKEAFKEAIEKRVVIDLEKINNENNTTKNNIYINIKKASEITTFSQATLYQYEKKKKIPHINVERKLIFNKLQLINWLNAHQIKTKEENEGTLNKKS